MSVTFPLASLAFCLAISAHNLEEAVWLPAWSERAGKIHARVGAREFRFAVIVLTALAWGVAVAAQLGGRESVGAYLLAGYALAMLLNVVAPHLLATAFMRSYAPGTATAVLLNLPACALLLRAALVDGYVRPDVFLYVGPACVVALLASIPLLFAIGRRLPV